MSVPRLCYGKIFLADIPGRKILLLFTVMTDRRGIASFPLRLLLLVALMFLAVLPLALPTQNAVASTPVQGYRTVPAVTGMQ